MVPVIQVKEVLDQKTIIKNNKKKLEKQLKINKKIIILKNQYKIIKNKTLLSQEEKSIKLMFKMMNYNKNIRKKISSCQILQKKNM